MALNLLSFFTFRCEILDQVIIIVINSGVEVHCSSVKHQNYWAFTLLMSNMEVVDICSPCIQRSRKRWDRDSLRPFSEYRCDYSDKPQSISSLREFHPIYSDLVAISILILLLGEQRKELTEGWKHNLNLTEMITFMIRIVFPFLAILSYPLIYPNPVFISNSEARIVIGNMSKMNRNIHKEVFLS